MKFMIEELAEELQSAAKAMRKMSDIRGARQRFSVRMAEDYRDPKKVEEIRSEFMDTVFKILADP